MSPPLTKALQRLLFVGSLGLVRFDHRNNGLRVGVVFAAAAAADVNSSSALSGMGQPVTFGYTLHTDPDSLDDQVTQVEKFVRVGLRKLVKNVTNVGRAANMTSSYDGDEDGE
jgi:hypothetical protein